MAISWISHQISKRVLVLAVIITLPVAAGAQSKSSFTTGVNYPWIAYGHDFGKNAWGHDGLITGGWTYQTYVDSRGFVDSHLSKAIAHSGEGSLSITADLIGKHPQKSKGEVYIDIRNHTPADITVPVDITHATVSCWLYLPRGSAGDPSMANGVQFFFKSGKDFRSLYTPYQNLRIDQEERWVRFTADAAVGEFVDKGFDPAQVIAVGVKVAINDESFETFAGTIFLDDYALGTAPAVAFDFERLEVQTDFLALQQTLGQCSAPAIRVFVFADGRAAPEFGPFDDQVTGLDEYFFQDFDALLEAAKEHDLMIIPVLLDFTWFDRPPPENGVQLGARSGVLRNSSWRQAFLDQAVKPFVQRYCGNPQIMAWEVINEPEWATKELTTPSDFPTMDPVALAEMQEFVRLAALAIHSCPGSKVTVGSARRMWLQYWTGLGLDLYQFHWYDHFVDEEPLPWYPYTQLGLDKPAFVGEVPTAKTNYSTEDYLLAAAGGGYDGLLVWSYRAGDNVSGFANARSVLEGWCSASPRRRAVR